MQDMASTPDAPKTPKRLCFFNHAGGVGKSTVVRDVGYLLAEQGQRVLLIDADPQANLTSWLGVRSGVKLEDTLYAAIFGERRLPVPLEVHGMSLIPSHLDLAKAELQLAGVVMGVTRLRSAVVSADSYDYVLIDPPPSLGQLSALAVIAADRLVVPVPTNVKGFEGVRTVVEMVREYQEASPELAIGFFALTLYDERTRHDRDSLAALSELSRIAPVSTPLAYRPAAYRDASLAGIPVPAFAPGSAADRELRQLTRELTAALETR
jgi:chromosome partitioning protein